MTIRSLVAGVVVALALFLAGSWYGQHQAGKAGRRAAQALQDTVSIAFAEIAQMEAHATRYRRQIDSLEAAREPVPAPRPPRPEPVPPSGSASDSAAYWQAEAVAERRAGDSLRADGAVMRRQIARSDAEFAAMGALIAVRDTQLGVALSALVQVRDSLGKALAPKARGFTLPLLGIRLCPQPAAGYAVLVTGPDRGAHGASVGVQQPFRCG